eukprot:TRINITY_DN45138_c0_g1_i1.p1 TRINITY_DN45138_c0_g1~~TRINITY_DN45138_c0_g1_i1.p1  ORF type:complete len:270 (+),score=73.28 TRINITY_DN45138_c0_g1_i1:94-903(+)
MGFSGDLIDRTSAIAACGRRSLWRKAVEGFEGIRQSGLQLDAWACDAAMRSLPRKSEEEAWPLVVRQLLAMQESGVRLGKVSINIGVGALPGYQWPRCFATLAAWGEDQLGLAVDAVGCHASASTAIGSASEAHSGGVGASWAHALRAVARFAALRLEADAVTQGVVVGATLCSSLWGAALEELLEVTCRGMETSVVSFSGCLTGCEKARRWQQSMTLLEMAERKRLRLDTIACNSAVSACSQSPLAAAALDIYARMQAEGPASDGWYL